MHFENLEKMSVTLEGREDLFLERPDSFKTILRGRRFDRESIYR
jgi:hypothetical protein